MAKTFLDIFGRENASKNFEPSPPSRGLQQFLKNCDRATTRSAWILKKERRRFGGNPLPEEPGGEEYFGEPINK